jgi:hypothetical protein
MKSLSLILAVMALAVSALARADGSWVTDHVCEGINAEGHGEVTIQFNRDLRKYRARAVRIQNGHKYDSSWVTVQDEDDGSTMLYEDSETGFSADILTIGGIDPETGRERAELLNGSFRDGKTGTLRRLGHLPCN